MGALNVLPTEEVQEAPLLFSRGKKQLTGDII
jgi:hypothetical protein